MKETEKLVRALEDWVLFWTAGEQCACSNPSSHSSIEKCKLLSWFRALSIGRRSEILTCDNRDVVNTIISMQRVRSSRGSRARACHSEVYFRMVPLGHQHVQPSKFGMEIKISQKKGKRRKSPSPKIDLDCLKSKPLGSPFETLTSQLSKSGDSLQVEWPVHRISACAILEQNTLVALFNTDKHLSFKDSFLMDVTRFFDTLDEISSGNFALHAFDKNNSPNINIHVPWLQNTPKYPLGAYICNLIEILLWKGFLAEQHNEYQGSKLKCYPEQYGEAEQRRRNADEFEVIWKEISFVKKSEALVYHTARALQQTLTSKTCVELRQSIDAHQKVQGRTPLQAAYSSLRLHKMSDEMVRVKFLQLCIEGWSVFMKESMQHYRAVEEIFYSSLLQVDNVFELLKPAIFTGVKEELAELSCQTLLASIEADATLHQNQIPQKMFRSQNKNKKKKKKKIRPKSESKKEDSVAASNALGQCTVNATSSVVAVKGQAFRQLRRAQVIALNILNEIIESVFVSTISESCSEENSAGTNECKPKALEAETDGFRKRVYSPLFSGWHGLVSSAERLHYWPSLTEISTCHKQEVLCKEETSLINLIGDYDFLDTFDFNDATNEKEKQKEPQKGLGSLFEKPSLKWESTQSSRLPVSSQSNTVTHDDNSSQCSLDETLLEFSLHALVDADADIVEISSSQETEVELPTFPVHCESVTDFLKLDAILEVHESGDEVCSQSTHSGFNEPKAAEGDTDSSKTDETEILARTAKILDKAKDQCLETMSLPSKRNALTLSASDISQKLASEKEKSKQCLATQKISREEIQSPINLRDISTRRSFEDNFCAINGNQCHSFKSTSDTNRSTSNQQAKQEIHSRPANEASFVGAYQEHKHTKVGDCEIEAFQRLQEDNMLLRDMCLRLEAEVAKYRNLVSAQQAGIQAAASSAQGPLAARMVSVSSMGIPNIGAFRTPSFQRQCRGMYMDTMSDDGGHTLISWPTLPHLMRQPPHPLEYHSHNMYVSESDQNGNLRSQVYTPSFAQVEGTLSGNIHTPGIDGKEQDNLSDTDAVVESDNEDGADPSIQGTSLLSLSTGFGAVRAPNSLRSRLCEDIFRLLEKITFEEEWRKTFKIVAYQKCRHVVRSLWPRAKVHIYGSFSTGFSLPSSDLDLVICLPKVRTDTPAVAPGDLEGRNAIKETWQQNLARYFRLENWVLNESIKIISHTAVPVIRLATDPLGLQQSLKDVTCSTHGVIRSKDNKKKSSYTLIGHQSAPPIELDISFEDPGHQGLQANQMVSNLIEEFPSIRPIVLVNKLFLKRRGLLVVYTGGLSSYALVLMAARYLQEQQQQMDTGSLLMGFLDFYGNHFDPRTIGISVRRRCFFSRLATGLPASFYQESTRVHARSIYQGNSNFHHNSPLLDRRSSFGDGIPANQHSTINSEEIQVPYKFDPLFIEDPLCTGNNVGRNCFRIFQIQRAWSDAFKDLTAALDKEIVHNSSKDCLLTCMIDEAEIEQIY